MMQKNNKSKKRWVSTVLLTGVILAGMMPTGAVVNAVGRDDSMDSTQESSQITNSPKSGFEKITEDADVQKTKEDSSVVTDKETTVTEDKVISTVKDEDTSKVKEESTTNKVKAAVPTAGYVGPTTDPTGTTWDEKTDYSASSKTAYVSQSGRQGENNEPVLYFGTKDLKFQPSSLTNNNTYNSNTNTSSWVYSGENVNENNPNIRKGYGIIINNVVPADRGYKWTSKSVDSIESAVRDGVIKDYKLNKNTAGTGFKATMYDPTYKLSYTFIEMYDADGGIYSYFSITNNDTTTRSIGAVQGVDTFVDSDTVPVKSLGANAGFKMVGSKHTLNYRLKNSSGNSLGDWTNYTAGRGPNIMNPDNIKDYFTGGALGAGMEGTGLDGNGNGKDISINDIKNPTDIFKGDSGFVIKANPKSLAPGESLTTGSYLTYKEVTPTIPPKATVTPSVINSYADLVGTNTLKIQGTVKDEDGTKGRIKISYPDGSTSAVTENLYNTLTVNNPIPYSATLDSSKLKPGVNKIVVTAIDDKGNEQTVPAEAVVNLITLGATPITQKINVGGAVSTVEKELIKDITIMGTPIPNTHTLKPDTSNPSKNPVNTGKVGHYIHDMLLTDVLIVPNKVAKIAIPVNVTDSDTVTDKDSAVYAHKFDTKTTDIAKLSDVELKALIISKSEAKGWILETGANSAVSVKSTTLLATSPAGTYKATITNAAGKEITIDITVTGGDLKITSAPDAISYGATSGVTLPYSTENFNLQRQDNNKAKVSIANAGQQGWNLTAKVSKPLTNGSNSLKGVLKYIDTNNVATDLDSGSVVVGSGKTAATQDVTWDAKQGIIANLNGNNTSLKAGKYAGEITWTLTDAP
ncbi:hypothetical protein [Dellaglioa algida]|uniref:hypothetical protein n=1 Tax=Dellaglioa algida TaxID=105612 RepID=UPI0024C49AE4|nr:hypothetical protein [Dellaglioa algida]MDK1725984.1 hypothetical protein [Dellaglioa algida]